MTRLLLFVALALTAPPQARGSEQRFLAISYEIFGDTRWSFTSVYATEAEAEASAQKIGRCGYWRVDLQTIKESYMAPAAVKEIHLIDPQEIPPPPVRRELRARFGEPPPLPPPPDVNRIGDCRPFLGHIGAEVIFVHYHWTYEGEVRAAKLVSEPGPCPAGTPLGLTNCANLRFWKKVPTETENPTAVLSPEGIPTGDYANTGDDFRFNVPHDPTGKTHRSWHVWGEAPGEG